MLNLRNHLKVQKADVWFPQKDKIGTQYLRTASTIKVYDKFPGPLKQLRSEIPTIDDLRYYSTKTETGVILLEEVRERLVNGPKFVNAYLTVLMRGREKFILLKRHSFDLRSLRTLNLIAPSKRP